VNTLLLVAAVLNFIYLLWLPWNIHGFAGLLLLFAEFGLSSLIILFSFNHLQRTLKYSSENIGSVSIDIFITVVNEPLNLLEEVIKSAKTIDYRFKKIHILDDGARKEVKNLAKKYQISYLSRPDKPQHYKAGNLNFGLRNSSSPFILTLDADQRVINPLFLKDLIGYFNDPQVAFVSTYQSFDVPENDFNHDHMFYRAMQLGKNTSNAAISVGSGSIYRRSALEKIGGFPTWSVVEDMYVSYLLHQAGFTSRYIATPYTIGTAPSRLPDIAKQRGTWALDSMRVLIRDCPLFKKNLSLKQRLHYFEIGYIYLVSAVCLPILFILPSITIFLGLAPIKDYWEYFILRGPSLALAIYAYYLLNDRSFSASQFWSALSFVYLKAFILALRSKKPRYVVTAKVAGNNYGWELTIPHLVVLALSLSATTYGALNNQPASVLLSQVFWTGLTILWFYPWILKGFGVDEYYTRRITRPMVMPMTMAIPPIQSISKPWESIPSPDSLALNIPSINKAMSETTMETMKAISSEKIR